MTWLLKLLSPDHVTITKAVVEPKKGLAVALLAAAESGESDINTEGISEPLSQDENAVSNDRIQSGGNQMRTKQANALALAVRPEPYFWLTKHIF